MMEERTQADWEVLSAYLDGELPEKQRVQLEARFLEDPGLQTALERLRGTRAMLRNTPAVIRKRSFTLTPEMVAGHTQPSGLFPTMRLVSILATMLFVVVVGGDLAVNLLLPGMGGAGEAENLAAAPEMAQPEEPAEAEMAAAAPAAEDEMDAGDVAEEAETETQAAPAEQEDAAGTGLAEGEPTLQGTTMPPLDIPQVVVTPDYALTPGIGGGAPDGSELVPATPTYTPTPTITPSPTATATPQADADQTSEGDRAMLPPQDGGELVPKVGEGEALDTIDRSPYNLFMLCLRMAEIAFALLALGAGIWAWTLRKT